MLEKLNNDLKEAMRSKDKVALITIRALKASIKNEEINKKSELSETDVGMIVMKEIKSRKDANVEFDKAGRTDLSDKNNLEIVILENYLPEMLSEDEINKIIEEVFASVNPTSPKDIGLIMKDVAPLVKGKADMSLVNGIIREKLSDL